MCIFGHPHILGVHDRTSLAELYKLTLVFHHLASVGPKQLSALAHLGCSHKVGTSYYHILSIIILVLSINRL